MAWYVAVIGPGETASDQDCATAYEVGRLAAAAGCVVVTGGLGGVMAAAAAGAREAGGVSVGLLPGTDRGAASPGLTVAIPTGLGELRNGLIIRAADAVVAVGGSWGTLSELALAGRSGLPMVSINGWQVTAPLGRDGQIPQVDTAADAVAAVLRHRPEE